MLGSDHFHGAAILGLTRVVFEPYSHRPIAEKDDAMRAIWIFLALGSFINMGMNKKSLTRMSDFQNHCGGKIFSSSFTATWTPRM